MKTAFCLIVLFVIGFLLVPFVYGQEPPAGPEGQGALLKEHQSITPEQLASFDEKTRAAWNEIETAHLKKVTNKYIAFASALAIGIAALAGALAQGRVGSAAMEGIARNPEATTKMFTPLIISFALIESLVIYAWVIAIWLQLKM